MLTRKQLEDASECRKINYCGKCLVQTGSDSQTCVEQAAQTALVLADMLKRLEWVPSGGVKQCPCCGVYDWQAHKPDCELAELLRRLEGEK